MLFCIAPARTRRQTNLRTSPRAPRPEAARVRPDRPRAAPRRERGLPELLTEASPEPARTPILVSAPAEETPLFGAEDLDEDFLGWDETTEAAVETSAGAVTTAANYAIAVADSADDEGGLTWAALKRDVTGAGDSAVAFLSEAAERENSEEKAEKLRGYAAQLGEALRTYSRAASDENRLVLPISS